MATSNSVPRRTVELQLPPMDQRRLLGANVVRRAATILLLAFSATLILGIIGGSLVSVRLTVDASGVLEPVRVATVRPAQDGLIRRVLVSTGDTVRSEQVLVVLDSLDLATSLGVLLAQQDAQRITRAQLLAEVPVDQQRQLAQRAQADAHVVRAGATVLDRMVSHGLGRNLDSLTRAYVTGTHVNIDVALSDLRSAQADQLTADAEELRLRSADLAVAAQDAKLRELQSTIRAARARLARLAILSPSNGVVLTEQVERLTGSYVRQGEQILEVGDPASWRADLIVNEADMHDIHRGDSVSVEVLPLTALKMPRLNGVVDAVGVTPTSPGGGSSAAQLAPSGSYRVLVSLDPTQLREIGVSQFRRGYSVTGKIVTRRGIILRLLSDWANRELRRQAARVPVT
ncbi:MAG: hypothetical protein JWM95_2742 [Gemmatimonadetes bacterium]|nr:hypothetical protein [Gemmatimonadota bacterium]